MPHRSSATAALLAAILVASFSIAGSASAAGVRTQGKSAKHIRFLVRATPYKRCRVVVRRGKARRAVTVDVNPRGRRSRRIRMPDRGRVRYRVRCRDAHLFFADPDGISSVPIARPDEAAVSVELIHIVAVGIGASGRKVVWTQLARIPTANGVYVANRDGSGKRRLYAPFLGGAMRDGALVGNWYYWLEGSAIARANIATGVVEPAFILLPPGSGAARPADGLTADRDYIYFASCGNQAIGRVRRDGAGLEQYFIPVGSCVRDVAVNSTTVYWPFLNSPGQPGAIGRASLDGRAIEPFWRFTRGGGGLGDEGIAADDWHVYWTSRDVEGPTTYVGRMRTDGTRVTPRLIAGNWLWSSIAIGP